MFGLEDKRESSLRGGSGEKNRLIEISLFGLIPPLTLTLSTEIEAIVDPDVHVEVDTDFWMYLSRMPDLTRDRINGDSRPGSMLDIGRRTRFEIEFNNVDSVRVPSTSHSRISSSAPMTLALA